MRFLKEHWFKIALILDVPLGIIIASQLPDEVTNLIHTLNVFK